MRKIILSCASFFVMALSISASPAVAQNVLWVGPGGSDANACTQTQPCSSFQHAIVSGAVQINCLASGNYGPIVINSPITIDCGAGNIGSIVNSTTSAISINTTAAATVILRHLALNGLSSNNSIRGIDATSFFSGTLIIEDCTIQGYSNAAGIVFSPQSGRGLLQVTNSQISGNTDGIVVDPQNGQIASVTLNGVELSSNSLDGILLAGSIVAGTIRKSVIAANGTATQGAGIAAGASQVFFTVEESSIIAHPGFGILTIAANAIVNVGATTIGGNGTGVKAGAGQIISFGNNQMSANATNGTFTSTTPRL